MYVGGKAIEGLGAWAKSLGQGRPVGQLGAGYCSIPHSCPPPPLASTLVSTFPGWDQPYCKSLDPG